MQQDQAVLVTIPGIGKKLAERVIFELKEKVAAAGIAAADVAVAGAPPSESDVIGALQALGYSLPEAREAARHGLAMAGVGASLEDRVKAALRVLVRD
jgi:Holliday junction DNA helicase RuvA